MAEGQPASAPAAAAAVAPKRAATNPLVAARGKFAKAQQEQVDAEARLQETNEVMQIRAAAIVKAMRKELLDKRYQSAWTKMQIVLRDRLCESSTRLGTKKELDDLLAGLRPPGSTTYLFRWALKQAVAPNDEMVVIECLLQLVLPPDADADYIPTMNDLNGAMYLEYKGQRSRFNELPSLRLFMTYVYNGSEAEADALSDDHLYTLCNDFLMHLTQDVIKMAQILDETYLPPKSFPLPFHLYYQWVLSDIRTLKVPALFHHRNNY